MAIPEKFAVFNYKDVVDEYLSRKSLLEEFQKDLIFHALKNIPVDCRVTGIVPRYDQNANNYTTHYTYTIYYKPAPTAPKRVPKEVSKEIDAVLEIIRLVTAYQD